jgi:hypothetical protein
MAVRRLNEVYASRHFDEFDVFLSLAHSIGYIFAECIHR